MEKIEFQFQQNFTLKLEKAQQPKGETIKV